MVRGERFIFDVLCTLLFPVYMLCIHVILKGTHETQLKVGRKREKKSREGRENEQSYKMVNVQATRRLDHHLSIKFIKYEKSQPAIEEHQYRFSSTHFTQILKDERRGK